MPADHAPLLEGLHGLVPPRKPRLLLVDDQPLNIQVMHKGTSALPRPLVRGDEFRVNIVS